jgi:hypothetical protein
VATDEGKGRMDAIRATIAELEAPDRSLLDQHTLVTRMEFATLCGATSGKGRRLICRRRTQGWQQLWEKLLSPMCPRLSVQAHAEHEHSGSHRSNVLLRSGRGRERRQQICQLDVAAAQAAQTLETFQEALARAQGLQPTRGAQTIACRHMTALNRLGRFSTGTV